MPKKLKVEFSENSGRNLQLALAVIVRLVDSCLCPSSSSKAIFPQSRCVLVDLFLM